MREAALVHFSFCSGHSRTQEPVRAARNDQGLCLHICTSARRSVRLLSQSLHSHTHNSDDLRIERRLQKLASSNSHSARTPSAHRRTRENLIAQLLRTRGGLSANKNDPIFRFDSERMFFGKRERRTLIPMFQSKWSQQC